MSAARRNSSRRLTCTVSATAPNTPVTMSFVVIALGSVFAGLVMRHDPESGLAAPILGAVKWLSIPAALTVAAVEVGFLQDFLGTTGLDGTQWLMALGLALIMPVVVEIEKALRRRRDTQFRTS